MSAQSRTEKRWSVLCLNSEGFLWIHASYSQKYIERSDIRNPMLCHPYNLAIAVYDGI